MLLLICLAITLHMPRAVLFGPQEESDEYEALLDKSLADKKDYLEIKYGYDADAIRERVEKEKYIFYDKKSPPWWLF